MHKPAVNQPTISDPVLPQLAQISNCQAMRNTFQQLLMQAQPSLRVLDCQIDRMKYKRGKSCLISYRLCLATASSEQQGSDQHSSHQRVCEQLICARFFPQGESARRFERAKERFLAPVAWGAPVVHLPELEMVAWFFPNDPKMVGLPRLMDSNLLRSEVLPSMLAQINPGEPANDWQIAHMTHTLVHYAPEHTCTVRVQLALKSETHEDEVPLVLYGKSYYNDDGAETARLMRELCDEPAHKAGHLALAQALDYDPQHRILWQRGLAGKPLLAYEAQPGDFLEYLQTAARSVAALHQCRPKSSRTITLESWLLKLTEMRSLLHEIRPERQAQIDQLIDKLLASSASAANTPQVLLHGDLHLQNFLVDEGKVALIDMDNLCHGSPWLDVGSFVASLFYRGIVCKRSLQETQRLTTAFCEAYADHSQWDYSAAAVQWFSAAALVNERVYRTITRGKGGSLQQVDALIDCATALLES